MKQFWLIKKTDDALLGIRKGKRTQKLLAGPFPNSTTALNAVKILGYSNTQSCTRKIIGEWIAIVSGYRPKDTIEYFEFFDHIEDQTEPNILDQESKWDKYLDSNQFPK